MKKITFPPAFLELIAPQLPDAAQKEAFIAACHRPLRPSIRVNLLKISVADFQQRMQPQGWQFTPIPWCAEGFWISGHDPHIALGNSAEHLAGLFYIQEATSMLPVTALLAGRGSLTCVLDMAAAPGSKTTQLAAHLQPEQCCIVANEYSASRLKGLTANLQRLGVHHVATTHFDGAVFGGWLTETFDAILLDAPCSGEGTLRKDPHALSNWHLDHISSIQQQQKELLISAFHALKPQASLVYSTCTLNQIENQQVCQHLKDCFGDAVAFESLKGLFPEDKQVLTPEGFLHVFPHQYDCEGFFVAKIRKLASVPAPSANSKLGKFPFQACNNKQTQAIAEQLKQTLNIDIADGLCCWQREQQIWLFPETCLPLLDRIRFQRIGLQLAEVHQKGNKISYRWQHQAILALADAHSGPAVDISSQQAQQWFMGQDIRPDQAAGKDYCLLRHQGDIIGIGKWVGNRIKNGLPRSWVRDNALQPTKAASGTQAS